MFLILVAINISAYKCFQVFHKLENNLCSYIKNKKKKKNSAYSEI
jgi:hypothetical protein